MALTMGTAQPSNLSMGSTNTGNLSLGTVNSPNLSGVSTAEDGGSFGNFYTNAQGQRVSSYGYPTGGQVQGAAYSDPYAQWGGAGAYNALRSGFDNQKSNIYGSATDAANNTGIGLRGSILDLVDSLRSGQTAVDNRGVNNDLAKQRGTADVYGAVNRGIRSGGVTLANKNASDSSAAGAIARAYGSIGQRQLSDIGNQYELENQDIGLAQQDLDMQRASGIRKIQGSKEQAVNSIVADAQNALAALDAAMASASLPDRIAIDAEKNVIRNQVLGQLAQYDTQLNEGVAGVRGMDQNARIAEATRRGSLGMAPANAFNYDTEAPAEFQDSGPFASELPIFTYKNRRLA